MMPPKSSLGVASTSFLTALRPTDPLAFLELCHGMGAGGIQMGLFQLDAAGQKTLRDRAGEYGMFLETMVPVFNADPDLFRAQVRASKAVGATVIRTGCLSGRRYETFATLAAWQNFVATSRKSIQMAIPILEQEKMTLALENHKDWTREEFLSLLRDYRSESLGVCIDTGNNISLLDDPYQIIEALAPYATSTHIKDMAWAETPEGFEMAEVPLGQGSLDLKRILATIRKARPNVRLLLETITRDPLQVPCLTPKYWTTFGDRKAVDLATTLAMVRTQKAPFPMARTSGLSKARVLQMEEDAVRVSLDYARSNLGLRLQ
ncbi:sugar phosphate isomerase/epimerase family protein [Bryobacter aggregatus]|uniref:sugar phosphate isomerase/epimerase family protein n=1 Tax=Bryobacter aggregatus TaxID=360054 RepID=UPI0006892994|nr:TIM barrel protein [Bryobacter aggregatus]